MVPRNDRHLCQSFWPIVLDFSQFSLTWPCLTDFQGYLGFYWGSLVLRPPVRLQWRSINGIRYLLNEILCKRWGHPSRGLIVTLEILLAVSDRVHISPVFFTGFETASTIMMAIHQWFSYSSSFQKMSGQFILKLRLHTQAIYKSKWLSYIRILSSILVPIELLVCW